jgi:hypothetical protein
MTEKQSRVWEQSGRGFFMFRLFKIAHSDRCVTYLDEVYKAQVVPVAQI